MLRFVFGRFQMRSPDLGDVHGGEGMRIMLRSEPQGAESDRQRRVLCVYGVLWLPGQMEGSYGARGRSTYREPDRGQCVPLDSNSASANLCLQLSVLCVYVCDTEQCVECPTTGPSTGHDDRGGSSLRPAPVAKERRDGDLRGTTRVESRHGKSPLT